MEYGISSALCRLLRVISLCRTFFFLNSNFQVLCNGVFMLSFLSIWYLALEGLFHFPFCRQFLKMLLHVFAFG